MEALAFNGSPRKRGNTEILLKKVLAPLAQAGWETQFVQRDGRLARPPSSILQAIESSSVKRSPAGWALQCLWNQPAVSVVLSGMSNIDQVEANSSENSDQRMDAPGSRGAWPGVIYGTRTDLCLPR